MKNRIFLFIAAFLFTAAVNAQSTVDSIAAKYKLIPMPEPLTIEKTFPVLGTYQLGADAIAMAPAHTTTVNADNTSASTTTTSPTTETTTNSSAVATAEMAAPGTITVTLDQENKGLVWVEGLPQGKFKAYLRKSPSSYRILAQKTESGEQIPEGTLLFDPETKMLNIALGKAYDDANPAAIFALNPALMNNDATTTDAATTDNTVKIKTKTEKTKTKAKVTYFTASKVEQNPSTTTTTSDATTAPATQQPAEQQQQPAPAPAPQQ